MNRKNLFKLLLAPALAVIVALSAASPASAYEQREAIVSAGHGRISPSCLVIHETANPGASAANHVSYWRRNQPGVAMTHYVMELDGSVVYHTQRDDTKAWHIGRGNAYAVGIELAHATNGADFSRQFDEAAKWSAAYLRSRGWGIDRLLSHNDCRSKWGGTDHTDPTGYFRANGVSWDTFRARVLTYLSNGTPASGGASSGSAGTSTPGKSGFQGGTYRVNTGALNIRALPTTSGRAVGTYRRGQTVNLDSWYAVANGYVWGRYTAWGGSVRYVAVGRATGKPEASDYLILGGKAPQQAQPVQASTAELARRMMRGDYGNGAQARRRALGSRYAEVQRYVNRVYYGMR